MPRTTPSSRTSETSSRVARPFITTIMVRPRRGRSEEHTSELQPQSNLVCRLLLEKKNDYPFSIWLWKQYGVDYPALHLVQRGLQVLLEVVATVVYFVPTHQPVRQFEGAAVSLQMR